MRANGLNLEELVWPLVALPQALAALARQSRLAKISPGEVLPIVPAALADNPPGLGRWLDGLVRRFDLEVEPVMIRYRELEQGLGQSGPLIFRLRSDQPTFLALVKGKGRQGWLVVPGGRVVKVPLEDLRAALCHKLEKPHLEEVSTLLSRAAISGPALERATQAMLTERLANALVGEGWLLRLSPGAGLGKQFGQVHLVRNTLIMLGATVVFYFIYLIGWLVVGKAAFGPRVEWGWLVAWWLLLFSFVPFRLVQTWLQGPIATGLGQVLKRRVMYGILRLESEAIRRLGVGQLLAYTAEAQAIETLTLSGGLNALNTVSQYLLAVPLLLTGPTGPLSLSLFVGWSVLIGLVGWRYWQLRLEWTSLRLKMTNLLVEGMVGQRTRQVQERRENWHSHEDAMLVDYLAVSKRLDQTASLLSSVMVRGWLLVGFSGLLPALVGQNEISFVSLAVGIGGVIFSYNPVFWLCETIPDLAGALIGWRQIKPISERAAHTRADRENNLSSLAVFAPSKPDDLNKSEPAPSQLILEAHDLTFSYADRSQPVIEGCHLQIRAGERVLLEGPSGGGKSTLASLLTGLREPSGGRLVLGGVDRQLMGLEGWREQVVLAPQFHENHVLTGTFAFNLLLGRNWPPRQGDLHDAEQICQELGLGDLLERMPAGLWQVVGETGWQLSHGERTRLFIARTLLQPARLLVLDESLAALDPLTLQQVVNCVVKRAYSVVVIAHP